MVISIRRASKLVEIWGSVIKLLLLELIILLLPSCTELPAASPVNLNTLTTPASVTSTMAYTPAPSTPKVIESLASLSSTSQVFPSSMSGLSLVTTSFSPTDWQYQWLLGRPCEPPCWQNIIPGSTDFTEGVKIAQALPGVTDSGELNAVKLARFDWSWGKTASGYFFYDKNDAKKIITHLGLRLDKTFRLGDVIARYGQPDYVSTELLLDYGVEIIFAKKGIVLTNLYKSKPTLNADLLFSNVIFTVPDNDIAKFTKYYSLFNGPRPAWQGYKDFEFYCRSQICTAP